MRLFEVYIQKRYVSSMQSEEADTRMFVHIKHVSLTGSLMLVISDINVVVLDIEGLLI